MVELLTVVAIIGVLAGILIPVTGAVRRKARDTQCLANLKSAGMAFFNYQAENRDRFPSACERNGDGWLSWDTLIGYTKGLREQMRCPFDEIPRVNSACARSYAMNDPLWQRDRQRGVSSSDMQTPSRTVLLSEWFVDGNTLGSEGYCRLVNPGQQAPHSNGTSSHVLWYDGHASSLRKDELTQALFDFSEHPAP